MICKSCKGFGKMTITMIDYETKKEDKSTIPCVYCGGTGEMTVAEAEQWEYEQNMWCECTDSPGSYYVPDTAQMKHHWCCNKCGKVTQIG